MAGLIKRIAQDSVELHSRFGTPHPFHARKHDWHRKHAQAVWQLASYDGQRAGRPPTQEFMQAAYNTATLHIMVRCAWAEDGLNTFELGDDLVAALISTDATSEGGLKWPFRGQLISIPKGWIQVDGEPVTLFLLSDIEMQEGRRQLCIHTVNRGATLFSNRFIGDFHARKDITSLLDIRDEDERAMEFLLRLSAAFGLWCATNPSAYKPQAAKGKRKTEKRKRPRYWRLAKRVNISPGLVSAAKEGTRAGTVKARRLATQHIVRGHFKHQPCGPGLTERKTIWVQPYWRGPDTEEAWARIYTT